MKIGLVIYKAQRQRGGAERYTIDLADALISRGHAVSILATKHHDAGRADPIQISPRGITRAGVYRSFCDAVAGVVNQEAFDIVHAMLPICACDVYQAHAGFERATLGQLTATSRLFQSKRRAFASAEDHLAATPGTRFLCLSNAQHAQAKHIWNVPEDRLTIIHNGVDLARFDPTLLPSRQSLREKLKLTNPAILFIGQDFHRKGLDLAISAIAKTSASLHVLGSDDAAAFRAQASRLGCDSRILFHGNIPDPREWIAACDALILSSRHDPFPLAVLEAMAMGLPPIVSSAVGVSEIIEHEKTGFITSGPEELVAAIEKAIEPQTNARLRQSLLISRDPIGYGHHLDRVEALYHSIAFKPE